MILGNDYVWRGSGWVAARDQSYDNAIRRGDEDAVKSLLRHTYRVLLTRGMRGTFIYSTDPETRRKVGSLLV